MEGEEHEQKSLGADHFLSLLPEVLLDELLVGHQHLMVWELLSGRFGVPLAHFVKHLVCALHVLHEHPHDGVEGYRVH